MKFALPAVGLIALAVIVSKNQPEDRQPVAASASPKEPVIQTLSPGDRVRVLELTVQELTARICASKENER